MNKIIDKCLKKIVLIRSVVALLSPNVGLRSNGHMSITVFVSNKLLFSLHRKITLLIIIT